jgi:hypothetical protein
MTAEPDHSVRIDCADLMDSTPTYKHRSSHQPTPRFERMAQSPDDIGTSTDTVAAATGAVVPAAGDTPHPVTRSYTDLAHRVATVGPAATEGELSRFIREARRRNVSPVLVAILADSQQPEVARQRAFGLIHAGLEQAQRAASSSVPSGQDAA